MKIEGVVLFIIGIVLCIAGCVYLINEYSPIAFVGGGMALIIISATIMFPMKQEIVD